MENFEMPSVPPSGKDIFLTKFRSSYELGEFEEIQKADRKELERLKKKYENARLQVQSEIFSDLLDEVKKREAHLPIASPRKIQAERKLVRQVPKPREEKGMTDSLRKIESRTNSITFEGMSEMSGEYYLADPNYALRYSGSIGNRKYSGVTVFDKSHIDRSGGPFSFVDGAVEFLVYRDEQGKLTIRHTESPRGLAEKKIDEYLIEKRGYTKVNGIYKKNGVEITLTENTKVSVQGIRGKSDEGAADVREVARIFARYKV